MKIAKIVATVPGNYTCENFIYLLVHQLNLRPRLMVNCGNSTTAGESKGWTKCLERKNPFNKCLFNELCSQNSQQQAKIVKRENIIGFTGGNKPPVL